MLFRKTMLGLAFAATSIHPAVSGDFTLADLEAPGDFTMAQVDKAFGCNKPIAALTLLELDACQDLHRKLAGVAETDWYNMVGDVDKPLKCVRVADEHWPPLKMIAVAQSASGDTIIDRTWGDMLVVEINPNGKPLKITYLKKRLCDSWVAEKAEAAATKAQPKQPVPVYRAPKSMQLCPAPEYVMTDNGCGPARRGRPAG